MRSELECILAFDASVPNLYSQLRQHCIIHDPPYNLMSMVSGFLARPRCAGRPVLIVVDHQTRSITIRENDIRHHVLHTAVQAFQEHRLNLQEHHLRLPSRRAPAAQMQLPTAVPNPSAAFVATRHRGSRSAIPNRPSGQTCSVCMDMIMTDDLQSTPCAHVFHKACISEWFQRSTTCPLCRSDLT